MYDTLATLNRQFSVALSCAALTGLLYMSISDPLDAEAFWVLKTAMALLAGSVLIDRKLSKLAFSEALESVMKKDEK